MTRARDVKAGIKSGRSKSTTIPQDFQNPGITNAMNPSSLKKLMSSKNTLDRAVSQHRGVLPGEPILQTTKITQNYRDLGKTIGVCPHELKAMMTGEIDPQNQLVMAALKNFISTVKISGAVDLEPVRRSLRQEKEYHASQTKSYQIRCRMIESQNRDLDTNEELERRNFYDIWIHILIELTTKISRNPVVTDLGSMDRWVVMALEKLTHGVKIVDQRITIDFEVCKGLGIETISRIPRIAQNLKKDSEYKTWCAGINKMTLGPLVQEYYDIVNKEEDVQKIGYLKWAIVRASGNNPFFDINGNLDVQRTLNKATYQNSEFIEDHEDYPDEFNFYQNVVIKPKPTW